MLPQFDLSFFPSQIFWLLVCFTLFYLFIQFYFFPKMEALFNKREAKIKEDVERHEANVREIQNIEHEYSQMLLQSQIEADETIKNTKKEMAIFLEKKLAEIDASLNAKFQEYTEGFNKEIESFEASLKDQVVKSAVKVIAKLEENESEEIKEEDIKKYLA